MDQREELRSLYCVVCPRCESVSQADDISCPYCGADRQGAVLTRTQASLFGIDEATRAMVRAASSQVRDVRRDSSNAAPQTSEERRVAALLPSLTGVVVKRNWIIVLAVVVCVLLGSYAWVRSAHSPGIGESPGDRVSAAGTVHKLAPIAPPTPSKEDSATESVEKGRSIPLAENRFLAMAGALGRDPFSLPALSGRTPCSAMTEPASLSGMPLCDSIAFSQAPLLTSETVPEPPVRKTSTIAASTEPPPTKAVTRTHARAEHQSAKARHQPTHVRVRAKEKTGPTLRSVRHAKKTDKTHSRSRAAQRTPAPGQEEADALSTGVQRADAVAPPSNPAMTTAGSWSPNSATGGNRARSNTDSPSQPGTPALNQGRGEAH
ncbi:conserved hypothetical protein [Burkholderia sp. 8Y]|nr:conserved hypothetical protein [Burkholderia sp. 8Y]